MSKVKKLNKAELLETELHNEKRTSKRLEQQNLTSKMTIINLEASILDLKKQLKIKEQIDINNKLEKLKSENEKLRVEGETFITKIKTKYKIKSDKFGFDPDTGEIKGG